MVDFRDYYQGLVSLSLMIFIFSLTFMLGSVLMKPYIALEPNDLTMIIILCAINFFFCSYYLIEASLFNKVMRLEDKQLIRYGKRIGVISCFYLPHVAALITFAFQQIHGLEKMMLVLIILMELLLIGLVFKQVHDLVFKDQIEREYELEKNRKRYGKAKLEQLHD